MGCYSPVADMPAGIIELVLDEVMAPVLDTLRSDGIEYRGFLYAGMMLTDDGPKVLEFNCRLGDPETQAILPRLEDDLLSVIVAAGEGGLEGGRLHFSDRAAVDVVLAAEGYPENPVKGTPVTGVSRAAAGEAVLVFHAGTARTAQGLVTAGGRVLNVVGLGGDVAGARAAAYRAAETIDFAGKHYRTDIAGDAT
jgi:phosphoribosylamine--glycine ligase